MNDHYNIEPILPVESSGVTPVSHGFLCSCGQWNIADADAPLPKTCSACGHERYDAKVFSRVRMMRIVDVDKKTNTITIGDVRTDGYTEPRHRFSASLHKPVAQVQFVPRKSHD